MKKDAIYLGNRPVGEKELCVLIIGHLSKNNETVKNNMIKYHMDEIKNVSSMLVSMLGGSFVEARAFNNYFHETVTRLGYTTSLLCAPYAESKTVTGLRM